jgi:hypothetical protein
MNEANDHFLIVYSQRKYKEMTSNASNTLGTPWLLNP